MSAQGFIYIWGPESGSEYERETVNKAKYSSGSEKCDRGET